MIGAIEFAWEGILSSTNGRQWWATNRISYNLNKWLPIIKITSLSIIVQHVKNLYFSPAARAVCLKSLFKFLDHKILPTLMASAAYKILPTLMASAACWLQI